MTGFFHHAFIKRIKRDGRKNEASNEAKKCNEIILFLSDGLFLTTKFSFIMKTIKNN